MSTDAAPAQSGDTSSPATEDTKNTLENSVNWFLHDKLVDPSTTIATNKYMTQRNELVHLTHCNVAEISVPRIKVQVFIRVSGGVQETGYVLYADHRFEKFRNDMIFGSQPVDSSTTAVPVTEAEAQALLQLINGLPNARQSL